MNAKKIALAVAGLFVDMDAMLGGDFEHGLENLDERLAAPPS